MMNLYTLILLICALWGGVDLKPVDNEENPQKIGTNTKLLDEYFNFKYMTNMALSRDCDEYLARFDVIEFGRHEIFPFFNGVGIDVLCDQVTDGGGWTIVQRRVDGSEDFYRNYEDYENGFGNIETEYWLGLKSLHEMTSHGKYEVRFDLEDHAGNTRYALYSHFFVGPPSISYKLEITGYSGNAGNSMSQANGMRFTTFDADNDVHDTINCAQAFESAGWFDSCHNANINGLYGNLEFGKGVNWYSWLGLNYSLKKVEMKIRRK